MATRVVEGKKPYTGGKAIDIDENKVISLRLRDENNLIIYDAGDDEIYVDLQLPDEITPTDAFPVGITTGRVIVDNGWDKAGTIIVAKTTSGDNIKILYADDGKLYMDNGTGSFKQIYFKADVDALLLALRQYIDEQLALKQDVLTAGDNISIVNNVISAEIPAMAKFLSVWDASLGEPTTQPGTLPYEYYTGDYYLVENVDSTTNYRPDGTEYDGTASSVVETNPIADGDTYIYDGTNWILQSNTQPTVSFSQIAGQPTDNTNLASALGAKQDTLVSGTNIKTVNSTSLLGTGDITVQETLVSGTNIKTINSTSLLGSGDITISAPTYTAGSHIDITNDVISAEGFQEELTAGDNITIEEVCTTESDMKGPCPSGFHVPLRNEVQSLYNMGNSLGAWSSSSGDGMAEYLKIPKSGFRQRDSDVWNVGGYGYIMSSTRANLRETRLMFFESGRIVSDTFGISNGYSIRPFKNVAVVPDNTWITLYAGTGSAGIFHNPTLGLISASNNGVDWITIADKNIGATTIYNYGDTINVDNTGNVFQWGNNYPFPSTLDSSTTIVVSDTTIDASNFGPNAYYNSNVWLSASGWDNSGNSNLRGGVSQGTFQDCKTIISATDTTYTASDFDIKDLTDSTGLRTTWGGKQDVLTAGNHIDITNNVISATGFQEELTAGDNIIIGPNMESDMKGPCPKGFHIATGTEWGYLVAVSSSFGFPSRDSVSRYFKIPLCGELDFSTGTRDREGIDTNLWASNSTSRNIVNTLYLWSPVSLYTKSSGSGYCIRPMKNSPVVPDSTWTVLYDGSSVAAGAGIFHNPAEELISYSNDGITWQTIADKNLGATVVYNYGDTMSESNCGKSYQRGNNYGFPYTGPITTSSVKIDTSGYGPGNYYSSDVFITASTRVSPWNGNLRGGATQGTFQDGKKFSAINTTQADVDSTAPSNPLIGQMRYDTANSALKVYDGIAWQTV